MAGWMTDRDFQRLEAEILHSEAIAHARYAVGLRAFARLVGDRIAGGRSVAALQSLVCIGLTPAAAWAVIEDWPEDAERAAHRLGWSLGEYLAVHLWERLPDRIAGGREKQLADWALLLAAAIRSTEV